MFDFVKNILGASDKKSSNAPTFDGHIALCVLLLEAAHVDGECSTEEISHLKETLITKFEIKAEDIDELVANSGDTRNESVDIFRFTRHMNNNYSKDEKIEVMESVWSILLVDDYLEKHEDHFAHKLANLLRLTHSELIDAKLAARKQLSQ
ncbi:tellurite resistance TerB family protein [Desulforhopalus sp. 52FAK]